ncbi:uncharacterized protein LOC143573406 [Bidens hawaiensis]|uniref:uncharacterized protein LOC143573406 n=1 Tax=Bidens hawaiensis TaxID=980011 RepID=UPI00404AA35D
MMINNLWVYDFNVLEESQSYHVSGFPVQESDSRFLVDVNQDRENDDPNSMKVAEMVECKADEKRVKGLRSKRCKRMVFEGLWKFALTPSMDVYGSVDNQEEHDLGERVFKKRNGENLENNDLVSESMSINSVGRWLEDVGFGRYAGVFEMHEVDEEALPLLTLDDLKEMGVLAVGPRRKLYAAICGLNWK